MSGPGTISNGYTTAISYTSDVCSSLTLGGKTWRLITRSELYNWLECAGRTDSEKATYCAPNKDKMATQNCPSCSSVPVPFATVGDVDAKWYFSSSNRQNTESNWSYCTYLGFCDGTEVIQRTYTRKFTSEYCSCDTCCHSHSTQQRNTSGKKGSVRCVTDI